MAAIEAGEIKVKVVPDFEDFYANVEEFLTGKLSLPFNDPLSRAIRDSVNQSPKPFICAKVGDKTFVLNSWVLKKGENRLETDWDSEEVLDKMFRISWRRRFRMVLDRLWWRATRWI